MGKNCAQGLEYGPSLQVDGRTQDQGHSFSHRVSPVNNIFFPAVNWLYRLQMGLFTQLLSFNGLARGLPTICKISSQRTSNLDSRQKKMY